ncbi:CDP-glucose 4,6-dehydratase [Candidatus Methylopumilus universalis]|jgi:CDP-glucose 4,6-dehydratase|uniref:CDP-glucose 4,6-dehydratase n=1 Tax=Candidatus Methylopumilus universalis TaxID=2588536 RepID=UPI0011221DD5|nr:CDP-glucose 4,6-dehydratase [Candidatus Methylopumilus universalis]QDC89401.1 CDP-glucose 4,6-dehydratase [Candidatus Methylopumilus universalis]QDC90702.1 CDP-glucose 4,6-dehydratase [Candidatus Methylopumilus universalis]
MSDNFWEGKNVFLTGHTGFKGSWLSLWLQSLGSNVTGYALPSSTNPNMYSLASVENEMTSIMGDLRDANNLFEALKRSKAEIVIHLAAQPLVRYSYDNPIETYAVNVMGTINLLEAIRRCETVRSFVNVTSDKCYENKEWNWAYRENEPLGGFDPYSSSKACAELVTNAYRSSFFNSSNFENHRIAIASARAGNVIAGGDWSLDRLIPDLIRAAESNQEIAIRNPQSIRPWQHVLEPLKGYLLLAEHLYIHGPEFAEAWNFGPNDNDTKSVAQILDIFTHYWGRGIKINIKKDLNEPHEAFNLKIDSTKAKNRLGWFPRWNADESVRRTCAWFNAYINQENMKLYALKEISEYKMLN